MGWNFRVRNFQQNSVYLLRLFSFREIWQNAVPYVTGNFQKIKPEIFIKLKAFKCSEKRGAIRPVVKSTKVKANSIVASQKRLRGHGFLKLLSY